MEINYVKYNEKNIYEINLINLVISFRKYWQKIRKQNNIKNIKYRKKNFDKKSLKNRREIINLMEFHDQIMIKLNHLIYFNYFFNIFFILLI